MNSDASHTPASPADESILVNGIALADLSPDQLDHLIQAAMLQRARSDSPVPHTLPAGGCPVITQTSVAFGTRDSAQEFIMLIRHPGAGWFGLELTSEHMTGFREIIEHLLDEANTPEKPYVPRGTRRTLH